MFYIVFFGFILMYYGKVYDLVCIIWECIIVWNFLFIEIFYILDVLIYLINFRDVIWRNN